MNIVANIKPGIMLGFTFGLLLFASLAKAGDMLFTDHPLAGKIWDMHSRSFIDEAALLARINTINVLLLGEVHDNPQHHENQQKLLKAQIESGAHPALMMEQLEAENQPAINLALVGSNRDESLAHLTGLIKFADKHFYSPLLAIAYDNKLPVIAANIPRQQLQPAIWRGYAAYDADELKRLAVEEVWDERRQNYLASQMGGAHCGQLREELRVGLSRSQRLRDALMVDSAVSSVETGIVAIVGRDHARHDIGLPLYFAARAPAAHIFSIGFVEVRPDITDPIGYETASATDDAPYDVIWFTPRADRTDPCANFVKPKEAQP